jgi:hypothetical protein
MMGLVSVASSSPAILIGVPQGSKAECGLHRIDAEMISDGENLTHRNELYTLTDAKSKIPAIKKPSFLWQNR